MGSEGDKEKRKVSGSSGQPRKKQKGSGASKGRTRSGEGSKKYPVPKRDKSPPSSDDDSVDDALWGY